MINLSEIWWFHKQNGHDSSVWDLMISQAERTWFISLRFDDFTGWRDMGKRTWFICLRFDDFTSWTDMRKQTRFVCLIFDYFTHWTDMVKLTWFTCLRFDDFTSWTDMIHLSEIWWFHKPNGHDSPIWDLMILQAERTWENGHDSPVWDLMISQAERTWFTCLRFDDFTSWTDMGKRKRFICRIWWFRKLNGHVKTNIIHLTEIWWFPKLSSATRPRVVS